jgi:hypothetical protein
MIVQTVRQEMSPHERTDRKQYNRSRRAKHQSKSRTIFLIHLRSEPSWLSVRKVAQAGGDLACRAHCLNQGEFLSFPTQCRDGHFYEICDGHCLLPFHLHLELAPERLGFCSWRSQLSPQNIEHRTPGTPQLSVAEVRRIPLALLHRSGQGAHFPVWPALPPVSSDCSQK